MKLISDVIKELGELQQEHGDIQVIGTDDTDITFTYYEPDDEDDVPALVAE